MQHEWPPFQAGSWRCTRCGCLSGSIDARLPCKPVVIYADAATMWAGFADSGVIYAGRSARCGGGGG